MRGFQHEYHHLEMVGFACYFDTFFSAMYSQDEAVRAKVESRQKQAPLTDLPLPDNDRIRLTIHEVCFLVNLTIARYLIAIIISALALYELKEVAQFESDPGPFISASCLLFTTLVFALVIL